MTILGIEGTRDHATKPFAGWPVTRSRDPLDFRQSAVVRQFRHRTRVVLRCRSWTRLAKHHRSRRLVQSSTAHTYNCSSEAIFTVSIQISCPMFGRSFQTVPDRAALTSAATARGSRPPWRRSPAAVHHSTTPATNSPAASWIPPTAALASYRAARGDDPDRRPSTPALAGRPRSSRTWGGSIPRQHQSVTAPELLATYCTNW
jgi:hypothetical protein